MPKRKKHEEEQESLDRWMLTYSDLITLLLGLFVILYAMSQVDKSKYQDFVSALTQRFGTKSVLAGHKGVTQVPAPRLGHAQAAKERSKDVNKHNKIKAQIRAVLQKEIESGKISVRDTPEGVSITLLEVFLFDSGKADIHPSAKGTLDRIAAVLNTVQNNIRVEGHTDNVPIHNSLFPSNWHLSGARALNTGYYLLQHGLPPQRLSIAGYSEYKPAVPNTSPENQAKNRRIEIVVLDITSLPDFSYTDRDSGATAQ